MFIGRLGNPKYNKNYVRYFKNIEGLEKALKDSKFEIDIDYAKRRIEQLEKQINKLKKDYLVKVTDSGVA